MCQEEIQEAVCASSLLRDSGLSADCMKVRKCHKGQIISDRQKGQEILGLVVSGRVDVYKMCIRDRMERKKRVVPGEVCMECSERSNHRTRKRDDAEHAEVSRGHSVRLESRCLNCNTFTTTSVCSIPTA